MPVCSVRRGRGEYAYYDSPREPQPGWAPQTRLGLPLEGALPVLPAGARMTGQGKVPRGVVCRGGVGGGLGAADWGVLLPVLLTPVGLFVLYAWLQGRK